jgi:Mlc titration factor MtfA (ptsG expression regulator)
MTAFNIPVFSFFEKILLLLGGIVALLYVYGLWTLKDSNPRGFYIMLGLGIITAVFMYRSLTARQRRRKKVLKQAFPQKWKDYLNKKVRFYQKLDPAQKEQFEKDVQVFLSETKITGVKTSVDEELKLLIASSAVIPIFGFKNWDYRRLKEVLVYPRAFKRDFLNSEEGGNVLGMAGDGILSQVVILSKPAVIQGFAGQADGHNTAIHEFVHLIDGADGEFDGIPRLMEQKYVLPWLDLIHREMNRIQRRKSKLRPYGATNKQEFFAVASEYFFERPQDLQQHHPKLYQMMSRIFRQDLQELMLPSARKKRRK